jgi:hypothetical protein
VSGEGEDAANNPGLLVGRERGDAGGDEDALSPVGCPCASLSARIFAVWSTRMKVKRVVSNKPM